MDDHRAGALWGAFMGDALALGVHWIYDPLAITRQYGRVDRYIEPAPQSYHHGRRAGDLTHYGEQMLILLESLAEHGCFIAEDFSRRWRVFAETTAGYVDQAMRQTLTNLRAGSPPAEAGSPSNELAGAARIAPLVYLLANDPEQLETAARAQTILTHRDAQTVAAAGLIARLSAAVLSGTTPVEALTRLRDEDYAQSPLARLIQQGLTSRDENTDPAIARFGRDCHTPHALPAVVHLIVRHEQDPAAALVANVMAGGDSAARGMLAGLVLGGFHGLQAFPSRWLEELRAAPRIRELLAVLAA